MHFAGESDFTVGMARAAQKTGRWFRWAVIALVFLLVIAPVVLLGLFRFLPVPFTPQIAIGFFSGDAVHYSWRNMSEISPYLAKAVIGGEDEKFCRHHGFDWQSIDQAIKTHDRHPKRQLRGASTLSQQAARSLFLVPWRSWIRKGTEAYLTVLMEVLWPKRRILAAYLNLVDWGHGYFGAEAAAQGYFHRPAVALTARQAARLAAILPNPDDWHAVHPGPYVAWRTGELLGRIRIVNRDRLDACIRP
ncbi:MAG TPA: monofunctional biosynthetic peptidoglycan transglycosylase [Rhizomicrobium sp.]|nr:monofunctional biosynthetic peptidoglycan transglycosylase [Rhizomicrobium sp.]